MRIGTPWRFVTTGVIVVPLLACGGLLPADEDAAPDGPSAEDGTASDGDGDGDGDGADEDAPPPTPEELFAALDADEEAPTGAGKCPSGTSAIRYPRGGYLQVYCATHSGKKQGTWTRWKGRRLVETRTYEAGMQEGRSTTWVKVDDVLRKQSESNWTADVQTGDHAEWSEDGTLLVRGRYVDGARHGRFIESELGDDGAVSFHGRCYEAGTETWHTTEAVAFVTDPCADDDPDEDEVAALQ